MLLRPDMITVFSTSSSSIAVSELKAKISGGSLVAFKIYRIGFNSVGIVALYADGYRKSLGGSILQ